MPMKCSRIFFSLVPVLALLWGGPLQSQTVEWNAAGAPTNSFELVDNQATSTAVNTCDGSTVSATWVDTDNVGSAPFPGSFQANTGNSIGYAFLDGAAAMGEGIDLELDFGGATGNAVEDLTFSLFDVDANTWTDGVTITAEFDVGLPVTLSCGNGNAGTNCTGFTIAGATATGIASTSFLSADGEVRVSIPGPVKTVNIRYEDASGGAGQVFGVSGFSYNCSAVPVTLAQFSSSPLPNGVRARWTTATETSNVGFYLYGREDGDWEKLHEDLIPSRQLDSLVPQHYRAKVRKKGLRELALAEVDVRGREKMHGPWKVGDTVGAKPRARPVKWRKIAQKNARASQRHNERLARQGRLSTSRVEWLVEQDGIYRVSYQDLLDEGFDFAGTPIRDLALTSGGESVAIRVGGADEGLFGQGSYIEFIGSKAESLYTRTNVYRLAVKPGAGERVPTLSRGVGVEVEESFESVELFETDRFYSFSSPNGDPWYQKAMIAYQTSKSWDYNFDVGDLFDDADARIEVGLWGVTNWSDILPDHHVVISVNGVELGEDFFDGLTDRPLDFPLPSGVLVEGRNTLTVTLPGDTGAAFDLVHLDQFKVRYQRGFQAQDGRLEFTSAGADYLVTGLPEEDVVVYATASGNTVQLVDPLVTAADDGTFSVSFGGRAGAPTDYWISAVSELLTPVATRPAREADDLLVGPANYLMIAHGSFVSSLSTFTGAKAAAGWQVKVVDIEDIYANYSSGVFDPAAIRSYLADVVPSLGIEHVLLVGADSYDYFDHLGLGSFSFIPTLYTPTHPLVTFGPSDPLLADFDYDRVPDVSLGRFPVRDVAELDRMVAKTLAYSAARSDVVFAADRFDGRNSFTDFTQSWIDQLPSEWLSETAFVDDVGLEAAREVLLEKMNEGVAITNYFGHSGPTQWSFENLLTSEDALELTNSSSPTMALQWGCWNGYHSLPKFDSISHQLLVGGEGGAALAFGAASLTEAFSDALMADKVLAYAVEPGVSIGAAVQQARRELGLSYPDVVLGMTLLGDPSLTLVP